jgi:hypothetical protein
VPSLLGGGFVEAMPVSLPTPKRVWLCEPRLHFTTLPSRFCLVCGKPMHAWIIEEVDEES